MISDGNWIPTGISLLDEVLKKGIPSGKLNVIVGKSRQIGATWAHTHATKNLISKWRAERRKEAIKNLFNI